LWNSQIQLLYKRGEEGGREGEREGGRGKENEKMDKREDG
jgi:hypothetical protein